MSATTTTARRSRASRRAPVTTRLRTLAGTALVAALALGTTACGESDAQSLTYEVRPERLQQDYPALAAATFGDSVDASEVLATVGDTAITVGEVATYLSVFPALSTEQAVQDLIDIHVGAGLGDAATADQYTDARLRGRAFAWLRANIWTNPEYNTPSPERVEQLLTEPEYRTEYSTPELVRVTHVLFASEGDENHTPELERLAGELGERVRRQIGDPGRPITGPDLLVAYAEVYPEDDPIRAQLPVHVDAGIAFPEEFSGPKTWTGLPSVVPRFGAAAFSAPVGTLVGPVESYYGWHMIVVEERIPAEPMEQTALVEMMEQRTIREQRGRATQAAVGARLNQTRILTYEDNVRLLALPPEERLRMDAAHLGDRYQ